MSSKYKRGKKIESVADFEKSPAVFYKALFGGVERTKHRAFFESWQYHTLSIFIRGGCVYEAELIDSENNGGEQDGIHLQR